MRTKMAFHRVGRHQWVVGCGITESTSADGWIRRYTATIRGFRNWKIYQGAAVDPQLVVAVVRAIRDRIDDGDETVFVEQNEPATDAAGLVAMATNHREVKR